MLLIIIITALLASFRPVSAESGLAGWLRYAPIADASRYHNVLPSQIVALNTSTLSPVYTAAQELQRGIWSIFGKNCSIVAAPASLPHHDDSSSSSSSSSRSKNNATSTIIVGTIDQYSKTYGGGRLPAQEPAPALIPDGFWLSTTAANTTSSRQIMHVLSQNERGALYGAFQYLSMLAQGKTSLLVSGIDHVSNPDAPIRWTNEWDNMDGSIERGFAGASLFFSNGAIVVDLTRAAMYARLLASIGINAVVVNNVNANSSTLSPANVQGLGRIADAFRPYGVQLGLSLNFASPTAAVEGRPNLTTFDPLDASVINWWTNVTNDLYDRIPDMAGYLVKADSEGEPGPITYNRSLSQGANLFAKALQPHGGIVMFRAFVYNQLNESDWKADRANAAVDFFKPLDGKFDDNVVVQIKYGPIDFQVREPTSPLFANLLNTSTAMELQVSVEYLGQLCHLVYLPPLWQTVLAFDLKVDNRPSLTRDIVSGRRFNRKLGGYAAVVNVGTNMTWLGSHLAMSNLYAYGRLAWEPTLDSTAILQDWIRLTFGNHASLLSTLTDMSMVSWPAYENYTGNLGIQTLTDILYTHYGPNPQSQDNNGWGQWTRADHLSVGMDRTITNGTGFSGQYPLTIASMYNDLATTPDNLVLWFHHVPWTHVLSTGKSVIQHFYDAHYAGASAVHHYPAQFSSLAKYIDPERYEEIMSRLHYQAAHALVWRDAITNFYHNMTGIPDAHNRVGNHPFRIEAESMNLIDYKVYEVSPFETASNASGIVTRTNSTMGIAWTALNRFQTGMYDLGINYWDLYGGASRFEVYVGQRKIGHWRADSKPWIDSIAGPSVLGHTPSIYLDGHSAIRTVFRDVWVEQGDLLTITGMPDGDEGAPLDYVVLLPIDKEIVD